MTVCRRADRLTLAINLQTVDDSLRVWLQFADIQQFQALTFSSGGGLGMGVSDIADCLAKYKRTEGGIEVLSDCVVFALCTALRQDTCRAESKGLSTASYCGHLRLRAPRV